MPRGSIPVPNRKRRTLKRRNGPNWFFKSGALCAAFLLGIAGDCGRTYRSRYLRHQGRRCLMKIDLAGKTALITGSTSGIGHAVAKGLAAAGAAVVVNGRTQGKVDAAVAAITKAVSAAKVRGVA